MAARVGFSTPASHIVTGRDAALAAIADGGRYVAKNIGNPDVPSQSGDVGRYRRLMTMDVDREQFQSASPEEFAAPIFIQKRIMEGHEHRVIAFGQECFAYRIMIPLEDKKFPDERFLMGGEPGRAPIYGLHYEKVEAGPKLRALTRAYLDELGLSYGAFDIVIQGDDHIFIECNPEGQWFAAARFDLSAIYDAFCAYFISAMTDDRRVQRNHD